MKKRYLIIAVVLFAFVLSGVAVFLRVYLQYRDTGLARFDVLEKGYTWNGKLLLDPDGEHALQYTSTERVKLSEKTRVDVDLSPYGFEGETFSYFLYNGYALCPDEGYEGLWPVSTPRRFLYRAADGIYQIHTGEKRAWPVFADSVEGVPEKGEDVLAFSAAGSYALSLAEGVVTVYHTDPYNDSLRVADVKSVDLNGIGQNAAFVAFTSDRHAVFSLETEGCFAYAAVDCESGEAVLCPADYTVSRGEPLARFYAQRPLTEEEGERYCAAWTNLVLGTEFLCEGEEEDLKLFSVSPQGKYAAARRGYDVFILSEKRQFCLSDVLEGERVLSVDFLYENVIAVSVLRDDVPRTYCYTILF